MISMILLCGMSYSQTSISAFGSKIVFVKPDSSVWHLIQDSRPSEGSKGVTMFKHAPIKDSLGRPVEPVIALVYENIPDTIDVIEYSVGVLGSKPYSIRRDLLGGYPEYSSDKHSVVFKGDYSRSGVKHKVMLGYIFFKHIGIELIGDATDGVYDKVESDIQKFIKSVAIKN